MYGEITVSKGANYYLSKVLTVIDWIRAGKSEEMNDCGKISGRCAEIVGAQVETLNEMRHIISEPATLNAYFLMASKREQPAKCVPNLFNMIEREPTKSNILNTELVNDLVALRQLVLPGTLGKDASVPNEATMFQYQDSISKAIEIIELVQRFFGKKG
jgi:hypothetical protein